MKKLLIILGVLAGLAASLMGLAYFLRKLEVAAEDEAEEEFLMSERTLIDRVKSFEQTED